MGCIFPEGQLKLITTRNVSTNTGLDWTAGLDYWNGLLDWHSLVFKFHLLGSLVQGGVIENQFLSLHFLHVLCFKLEMLAVLNEITFTY